MKSKVVIFSNNTVRVITTQNPEEYADNPEAIINPDLTAIRGIPPHKWTLVNGKIVASWNSAQADHSTPKVEKPPRPTHVQEKIAAEAGKVPVSVTVAKSLHWQDTGKNTWKSNALLWGFFIAAGFVLGHFLFK
jgi:hypothetical protein